MAALLGGDNLQKALAEISKRMEGSVNVGFLEGATYPDGTPVAQVAFWNEYGTTTIPPRPFFRTTIEGKSQSWSLVMAKAAYQSKFDGEYTMKMVGIRASEDIQQAIVGWTTPGNADSTIAIKGFDKPLIHGGDMMRAVDYEVNPDD